MLRLGFITLFPGLIREVSSHSVIGRAVDSGLIRYEAANPRDFAYDRHHTVDDSPYGGEAGMLLKPEPVALALESILDEGAVVIDTNPAAPKFGHVDAVELSRHPQVIFLCGHYEGIDARVAERYATHSFSVGDFIVTGGELPALLMADAIARQVPGVLGNASSLTSDSFSADHEGLLSAPNYTRPEVWRGMPVPEVLRSGDHAAIARYRRQVALDLTTRVRPDLMDGEPAQRGNG